MELVSHYTNAPGPPTIMMPDDLWSHEYLGGREQKCEDTVWVRVTPRGSMQTMKDIHNIRPAVCGARRSVQPCSVIAVSPLSQM